MECSKVGKVERAYQTRILYSEKLSFKSQRQINISNNACWEKEVSPMKCHWVYHLTPWVTKTGPMPRSNWPIHNRLHFCKCVPFVFVSSSWVLFWNRVSLCSPSCSETCSVDQAVLEFTEIRLPGSSVLVLGLKVRAIIPGLSYWLLCVCVDFHFLAFERKEVERKGGGMKLGR